GDPHEGGLVLITGPSADDLYLVDVITPLREYLVVCPSTGALFECVRRLSWVTGIRGFCDDDDCVECGPAPGPRKRTRARPEHLRVVPSRGNHDETPTIQPQ